ncbi:MAG: leucine--tRNA ligase [Candidatus Thorarchaeota archaeon]
MIDTTEFKAFLKDIGPKWQQRWEEAGVFNADPDPSRPKFFLTFPYPYVNGSVHMGHGYSILKVDFLARLKRMLGYNVLFPQGFHATGEPIVGMAKRLREKDTTQQSILRTFGVEDKDFEKFYNPRHIVDFFVKLMTKDMKDIGLAIDWRRKFITTPITPVYSRFVEWQYLTLKELGYVKLGSHPVIWCPKDQSPTGDHDRLVGDGVTIAEYVLIKFPYEDKFFLPATLRPETTFGVTNMFLHPEAKYVTAKVDGEKWIVSQETVLKLKDQEHRVQILSTHSAREFFGKYCKNPLTGDDVIIVPATFVGAEWGAGVVMSVPAHAPVDWVALKNLKENAEELEREYGISKQDILSIHPISLISIDGYGEFPAGEIIERMGISDQNDPQVEKATKEIYRVEFHTGICKEITGKYGGRMVKELKDELIDDFKQQGIATVLYEPAEEVVCRCGTRNHVKVLSEQWFLDYGNPSWKKAVHQEIERMKFFPPVAIDSFKFTVDWLKEKACARKSGLGTPLPWDPEWIVETLSDSTIYMAYYIVSKYVNEGKIQEKNAVPQLFDYVFRGLHDLDSTSKISSLSKELISNLRDDFLYWYPMDLRSSGKDLIHNHLTYCLFQHQAIFNPQHRPRMMGVNGHMTVSGQKMSKSRGVLTALSEAVKLYSADLARIGLLGAGEGLDDANFVIEELDSYKRWLEQFKSYYEDIQTREESNDIDRWITSRMQGHIKDGTQIGEALQTRSYVQRVLFGVMNDLRHYKRRSQTIGPGFVKAVQQTLLLLTPMVPHFCEELWSLNHDSMVVSQKFPIWNESLIDQAAEAREEYISDLIKDIGNIQKAMKLESITNIEITITPVWKETILKQFLEDKKKLIPRIMQISGIKQHGKKATNYAQKLLKSHEQVLPGFPREEEYDVISSAIEFIEKTTQAKVTVKYAENSESPKLDLAEPLRPAIYIE